MSIFKNIGCKSRHETSLYQLLHVGTNLSNFSQQACLACIKSYFLTRHDVGFSLCAVVYRTLSPQTPE